MEVSERLGVKEGVIVRGCLVYTVAGIASGEGVRVRND